MNQSKVETADAKILVGVPIKGADALGLGNSLAVIDDLQYPPDLLYVGLAVTPPLDTVFRETLQRWSETSGMKYADVLIREVPTVQWRPPLSRSTYPTMLENFLHLFLGPAQEASGQPFRIPTIAAARNVLRQEALDRDCDLFFLDSDIWAPPDTLTSLQRHLRRLVKRRVGIASAPYPARGLGGIARRRDLVVGVWDRETYQTMRSDKLTGERLHVDDVGFGACLVARSLMEDLSFIWPVVITPDDQPIIMWLYGRVWPLAEDLYFCYRTRQLGYQIILDTSVLCGHLNWPSGGFTSITFPDLTYVLGPGKTLYKPMNPPCPSCGRLLDEKLTPVFRQFECAACDIVLLYSDMYDCWYSYKAEQRALLRKMQVEV